MPDPMILVLSFLQVVGPGDIVAVLPQQGKIKVGAGLYAEEGKLHTTKAGLFRQTKAGKIWTEGCQKRSLLTASPYMNVTTARLPAVGALS